MVQLFFLFFSSSPLRYIVWLILSHNRVMDYPSLSNTTKIMTTVECFDVYFICFSYGCHTQTTDYRITHFNEATLLACDTLSKTNRSVNMILILWLKSGEFYFILIRIDMNVYKFPFSMRNMHNLISWDDWFIVKKYRHLYVRIQMRSVNGQKDPAHWAFSAETPWNDIKITFFFQKERDMTADSSIVRKCVCVFDNMHISLFLFFTLSAFLFRSFSISLSFHRSLIAIGIVVEAHALRVALFHRNVDTFMLDSTIYSYSVVHVMKTGRKTQHCVCVFVCVCLYMHV